VTVDRVYAILAKVDIGGQLSIDCPSGGHLDVDGRPAGEIHLNCSDMTALRDLTGLLKRFGPGFSIRNFSHLRNPLLQLVTVRVGERRLLTWAPDKLPNVRSLSLLLGLLRGKR
jgi:hypothetical protein